VVYPPTGSRLKRDGHPTSTSHGYGTLYIDIVTCQLGNVDVEDILAQAKRLFSSLSISMRIAAHALAPLALSAARCEQCRFVPEMIA